MTGRLRIEFPDAGDYEEAGIGRFIQRSLINSVERAMQAPESLDDWLVKLKGKD